MQKASSSRIFVSYRREDTADATGRIFDRLQGHFGREKLFLDVDSVPFGVDFRDRLVEAIRASSVLLVVIGDRWMTATGQTGERRIHEEGDYVRAEIEAALENNLIVIPVLVGNAAMPAGEDLPPSVRNLAYRNAAEVRSGRDFNAHMSLLLSALDTAVGDVAPKRAAGSKPARSRAARSQAAGGKSRGLLATLAIVCLLAAGGLGAWSAGLFGGSPDADGTQGARRAEPPISSGREPSGEAPVEEAKKAAPEDPPKAPPKAKPEAPVKTPDPAPQPPPARRVLLALDEPATGTHMADANPFVRGHFSGDLAGATIRVNGVPATVNAGRRTFVARILLDGDGTHSVRVTCDGDELVADPVQRDIVLDTVKPVLTITEPTGISTIQKAGQRRSIRGTVRDAGDVMVTVDGKPAKLTADSFAFEADVGTPGMHVLQVLARDQAGHVSDTQQVVFDVVSFEPGAVELLPRRQLRVRAQIEGSLEGLLVTVGGTQLPVKASGFETTVPDAMASGKTLRVALHRGERLIAERALTVPERPVPPELKIDVPTQRTVRAVVRQPIIRGRVAAEGVQKLSVNGRNIEILPGGHFEYRPTLHTGREETFRFEVTDQRGETNEIAQTFERMRAPTRLPFATSLEAAKVEAARTGKLVYVAMNCYKPP